MFIAKLINGLTVEAVGSCLQISHYLVCVSVSPSSIMSQSYLTLTATLTPDQPSNKEVYRADGFISQSAGLAVLRLLAG